MMRHERGSAMVETALVVGLALVVIFNGLQLAILGFLQLHADAVAFTAARFLAEGGAAASYPSGSFPPAMTLSLTNTATTAQAVVTKTASGLRLLPGVPASVVLRGEHQETFSSASTSTVPPFQISESLEQLVDYYAGGTKQTVVPPVPSTHAICLAHTVSTGQGNGVNGAFKIWNDHASTFQKAYVELPSSWSAGTLSTTWQRDVPKSYSKNQAAIDGWDATAPGCSGT